MADKKIKKSDKAKKSDKVKKKLRKSGSGSGAAPASFDAAVEFRAWLEANREAVMVRIESATGHWLSENAALALAAYSSSQETPAAPRSALDTLKQHGWSVGADGCWHWQGRMSQGRPVVVIRSGRPQSASRAMFSETVRKLGPNERLARSCDNPACVNPEHYTLR
jgi:hypothetical protein